jgi:L-ribulokinase
MLQIYADVLGRPIRIAREEQTTALGASILAAAAAGFHETPAQAVRAMTAPPEITYFPDRERSARYDVLYAEYRTLAEYFSGINQVMHRL